QALDGDDGCVLGPVGARDDREHGPRPGAVQHGDRNVVTGVRPGRHVERAVRFLAALSGRGPDGEGRMRVLALLTCALTCRSPERLALHGYSDVVASFSRAVP